MIPPFLSVETRPTPPVSGTAGSYSPSQRLAFVLAAWLILATGATSAQVITIDTKRQGPIATTPESQVDRRYAQITPTDVPLPKTELDAKTRLELIRVLQSEQGFAMRPFPRGHKGLTLVANGKLEPAGEGYLNMVIASGTSAKPGDRLVISDVKIEKGKIIFELNGGPDLKHRFLRHIEIGTDPNYSNPVVQDNGQDPVGSRLTLDFGGRIPALTGAQVKLLLAPLISFDVKTPIQAFTDTLPTPLKQAILDHHVMVGMSMDMVVFAKGQPRTKTREMDGQMPFEEWIYGTPPEEVDFVRINGNRVIRVEIAKIGESPMIFTKDEVSGMMRTDGRPIVAAVNRVHVEKEGDVQRDPDKEAPAAPPTLRNPGEQLPADQQTANQSGSQKNVGVMKPVQMPKQKQPGANPDSVPDAQQDGSTPAKPQSAPANAQSTPADSSQQPEPVKKPSPAAGTNQPN
ncbi:MAG TPA: hypothetical protein VH308_10730 [Terracidiphilus sp.]|nr:hypothetical protein [Terracidiphilus sp.]